MTKAERILAYLATFSAIALVLLVIWPQDPRPLDNRPSNTAEIKFTEKRTLRIRLGADAEMRLAFSAKDPYQPAISVICPRGFIPESGKSYYADCYELRDEDGNTATNPVWILRYQLIETPQYGLTP